MEKLKPLETSKTSKNSAPPNHLYNKCCKNFSRLETQEKEKTYNNKPKTIKKIGIGTYISIIILNVNGLNAPTKRHKLAEWIQKQDPYICCLQETHFRLRDTYRLKMMG